MTKEIKLDDHPETKHMIEWLLSRGKSVEVKPERNGTVLTVVVVDRKIVSKENI